MILEKTIVSSSGIRNIYSVKSFVEYFDPEIAECLIRNRNSYIYDSGINLSDDDLEMLLASIFLKNRARVRMCSGFWRNHHGHFGALNSTGYDFWFPSETNDALPNPYTYLFLDFGTMSMDFALACSTDDAARFLWLIDLFGKQINFGDTVVTEHFIRLLADFNCIELITGEMVNAYKAVEFFRNEE